MKRLAVINETPDPCNPHLDVMKTYDITGAQLIIKQLVEISKMVNKNPTIYCDVAKMMAYGIEEIRKHVRI